MLLFCYERSIEYQPLIATLNISLGIIFGKIVQIGHLGDCRERKVVALWCAKKAKSLIWMYKLLSHSIKPIRKIKLQIVFFMASNFASANSLLKNSDWMIQAGIELLFNIQSYLNNKHVKYSFIILRIQGNLS